MISGEQIATLIKNPHQSSFENLAEIEALITKYPYCSSLYHLSLKAAANSGSVEFEDKLKIAAAHVGDREHLYHLIHEKKEILATEIEVRDERKSENSDQETSPIVEENLSSETKIDPEEVEEKDVIESPIEFAPDEIIGENLDQEQIEIPEKEESSDLIQKTEIEDAPEAVDSELDADILSHAISIAFEHSAETAIPEKEITEESAISTTSNLEVTANAQTENEILAEDQGDLSFIDWLQLKQSGMHPIQPKKTEPIVSEEKTELKLEIKESSKSEINDLLDKFIAEEPSISKPTKEFYSPSANAKKSLEESSEIVSETLAKIHVMQGNFSKAIAAYKQLSLLYPEKNSFFATQIEKIKQKQSQ